MTKKQLKKVTAKTSFQNLLCKKASFVVLHACRDCTGLYYVRTSCASKCPRHSARQQSIEEEDEQDIREELIEEDEEETVMGGLDQHNTADLETVKNMCLTYCRRLNLTSTRVTDVSERFAEKIFIACRTVGHTPPSIAAVSVFVASHLTGAAKTLHWVSMMSGVYADVISGLYFFYLHGTGPC